MGNSASELGREAGVVVYIDTCRIVSSLLSVLPLNSALRSRMVVDKGLSHAADRNSRLHTRSGLSYALNVRLDSSMPLTAPGPLSGSHCLQE